MSDTPAQFRDAGPYQNRHETERAAKVSRPPTVADAARMMRAAAETLAAGLRRRLDNAPQDALTPTDAAMLAHCEAVAYHAAALDRLNGCATRPQDAERPQVTT